MKKIKQIAKILLPADTYNWVTAQLKGTEYCPPLNKVNFGSLRRLNPISREFGYDRGVPIDRYYIENFLKDRSLDIQGRVLEIGDATYTRKFGGDRVTKSDVLHVLEGNPNATIVGDLTDLKNIPLAAFDCIILTQTLHLIYDMKTVVANIEKILKPGGVLLATVPGISQVVKCDWGNNWHWALTSQSARMLFSEFFLPDRVRVENHGNVLAAISFLQGLAVEELSLKELDYQDNEYQVIITIRVVK